MTGITASGFVRDRLATILVDLENKLKGVHGSDIVLTADSEDGQIVGIFADAISDLHEIAEDIYDSFNPDAAMGQALLRLGSLCGISIQSDEYGYVPLQVQIAVGETVYAGTQVEDSVTHVVYAITTDVGPSTDAAEWISCTGKATVTGTVKSVTGNVTTIPVTTFGFLAVRNIADGTAGVVGETQEAFRARRTRSVAKPSQSIFDALYGAVADLEGIGGVRVYQNKTAYQTSAKTGDLALAPKSIAVVVKNAVATLKDVLWLYSGLGCDMMGTTSEMVADSQGQTHAMRYYLATPHAAEIAITYTPVAGQGFDGEGSEALVKAALVDWINNNHLPGDDVVWSFLFDKALDAVPGITQARSFRIVGLTVGTLGGTLYAHDMPTLFNEVAAITTSAITMTDLTP